VVADLWKRRFPKAIATVLIAPLGFVGYVGYLAIHYHDVLFWWHLQHQAWGARIDFGRSLFGVLRHPWLGGYQGKGWMEWVGVVAVLGAIYAIAKAKLPPTIVVYCASVFVLMFISNSLGFKPRLLTWAFPSLIAVAVLLRERGWQFVALSFAYLMPLVFVVYSSLGNYIIQP
jgi:hypothetical protein